MAVTDEIPRTNGVGTPALTVHKAFFQIQIDENEWQADRQST